MERHPQAFTPSQLEFLAALDIIAGPVSLDLAAELAPLPPAALVDLIRKSESSGVILLYGDTVTLAGELPPQLAEALKRIGTPAFASELRDRALSGSHEAGANRLVLARISARAGLRYESAFLESEVARELLGQGNVEQAMHHLQGVASNLRDCLREPRADALFIATALDLSHASFLMGKGYPEVPGLLNDALLVAERLGDKRSQALVSLHIGRFFFLSDRLSDALATLSSGLEKVRELGDEDMRVRSSEFEGLFYYIQGKHQEASACFSQAAGSSPSDGTGLFNIFLPANLGYSYAILGQFHRATGVLGSNLRRAQICSRTELATFFRSILTTVLLMMGKTGDALHQMDLARQEALAQENERALFFIKRNMAFYHFIEGRVKKSYDALVEAVHYAGACGIISRQNTWPWILTMLDAYAQHGYAPIEDLVFEEEMGRVLNGPNVHLRGVAGRIRAQQAARRGVPPAAVRKILESSAEDLRRAGDPFELAKTLVEIAGLDLDAGNTDGARGMVLEALELAAGYDRRIVPREMESLLPGAGDDQPPEAAGLAGFFDTLAELLPSLDSADLHARVIRAACRFFRAERGGIFWFDRREKASRPVLRAAYNLTDIEVSSGEFQPAMTLVFKALRSSQPLLVRPGRVAREERALSILCLPVEVQGSARAVLYLENAFLSGSFDVLQRPQLIRLANRLGQYFEQIEGYFRVMGDGPGRIAPGAPLSAGPGPSPEIMGEAPVMRDLLARTDQVAGTDAPVLILGETGVGKELLARRLHAVSPRSEGPFVVVDPVSIPENLVESELFGHERGAFTGADRQKPGRIDLADRGTLFLDEIGDVPLFVQTKLLRVLQEKTFTRLGGRSLIRSDFRLIAATNRDLAREVKAGAFREDLYYRLNVVPLVVPPLRERGDDIVLLAEHFLTLFARKYGRRALALVDRDREIVASYAWPGNVRELRNLMERAVILASGDTLELSRYIETGENFSARFSHLQTMDEMQRQYIEYVLRRTGGRIGGLGGAAEILGMKRTTLNSRIRLLKQRLDEKA
jgi:transcriptional regulator with GAF, ATPase, and Fis domain